MISNISVKLKAFFENGHQRTLRAKRNIAISLLLKGCSVAIGLFLIPMTIGYVNPTQYGIWLTLSSIIGWFSFFDIGLGNGLKNKLAEAIALNQSNESKIYVSTSYFAVGVISSLVFASFFVVNQFIDWRAVLNAPDVNDNFRALSLIIIGFFCIQLVVQLINPILTASHSPSKVSFINVMGQLLSIVLIYFLTKEAHSSLIYLVVVLAGAPVLVQLIATIWLFKSQYSQYSPGLKYVQLKFVKKLLNVGGLFFVIQIGAIVLFQTDNIVVIQLFGPQQVTVFNVAYKLFSVLTMLFTIVITPFWSAFTDAYVKEDFIWIQSIFKTMNKFMLFIIAGSVGLLAASGFIYRIWLHGSVIVPFSLSFVMAVNVIVYCWQTVHVYFLNGISKIRLQLYLVLFTSIVNIPLSIFLGHKIGIIGVTLSNILVFILIGVFVSVQTRKILNKTATGIFIK